MAKDSGSLDRETTEIDHGSWSVEAERAEVLARSTALTKLRHLDMPYGRIGDDGLTALARGGACVSPS